jgi:hypothetical protein
MGGDDAGGHDSDEKDPAKAKEASDRQPPRHVPERRGTVGRLGGRRASDRRGEDDKNDGNGKEEDKDESKDKEKDKDKGDGKDQGGKDGAMNRPGNPRGSFV